MGEYAAIVMWTSIGACVAGVFALFRVRVAPRRPPPSAPALPVDVDRALDRLQLHAAMFVSFGFLALVLAAWAAGLGALGRNGLGVAAAVTVPLLVGFANQSGRRRRASDTDTPASSESSTGPPEAAS